MKKNKGFTLVELLAIVAIAGCLIAIAAPYYLEHSGKPNPNIQNIQYGVTFQFPDDGKFESLLTDLMIDNRREDPTHLYFVKRPEGPVEVYRITKEIVITLEDFKKIIRKK